MTRLPPQIIGRISRVFATQPQSQRRLHILREMRCSICKKLGGPVSGGAKSSRKLRVSRLEHLPPKTNFANLRITSYKLSSSDERLTAEEKLWLEERVLAKPQSFSKFVMQSARIEGTLL